MKTFSYNLVNSFSGTNKLFEEKENNIFFVFNFNSYSLGKQKPKLILPKSSKYELSNGVFTFEKDNNLIVLCAGSGIVKKTGTLENGLKYIEILHSGNFITRYENLRVLGVGKNYNVMANNVIGTLNNEPLIFKILQNDDVFLDYEVLNGEIKWKS